MILFSYIAKKTNLCSSDVTYDVNGFCFFLYSENNKSHVMTSCNHVTNEATFWKICLFTSHFSFFPNYIATVYAKTYYCYWFEEDIKSDILSIM